MAREEVTVPRVTQDRKERRDYKEHVETLVQKERKDCRVRREKKEIRDGLVSLVPRELQDQLAIRVNQVLPARADSLDPKATEVRTGPMDLPARQDR